MKRLWGCVVFSLCACEHDETDHARGAIFGRRQSLCLERQCPGIDEYREITWCVPPRCSDLFARGTRFYFTPNATRTFSPQLDCGVLCWWHLAIRFGRNARLTDPRVTFLRSSTSWASTPGWWVYTRFQCYVHSGYLSSSILRQA